MAKTASLNIRVEPATKTKAEVLFSNFGITLSDAVTMFLNQSIIDGACLFKSNSAAQRHDPCRDARGGGGGFCKSLNRYKYTLLF